MSYSVLIVDDDKELRTIYRMILERQNYTIYEASNGAEALKFLANQTPDVLLVDMLMPMLGGEAVIQRVRQMPSLRNMRVVVLTAYPRYRDSALQYEADHFLVKPIKPNDLLAVIAASVEASRTPES